MNIIKDLNIIDIYIYNNMSDFEKICKNDNILRGIYNYGYEKPSEIQIKTIPLIIDGKDILAQAQSGTGKTASFVIGSMHHIDVDKKVPQILIISPVRELSEQIFEVYIQLSTALNVKCSLFTGGSEIMYDKKNAKNVQVVIGTVGRLLHLLDKQILKLQSIKVVVFDEVDRMLNDNFETEMKKLMEFVPENAQMCMFSATITDDTIEVVGKIAPNAVHILIEPEKLTLDGIAQFSVCVDEEYKLETLIDLYKSITVGQSIIFANKVHKITQIEEFLTNKGFPISVFHSKISKLERNELFKKFKNGTSRIMLSSDVLSRGIDVQQISVVINYDIPDDYETFLHRCGRSGRFGKKGMTINLVSPRDGKKMQLIAEHYGINISPLENDFMKCLA
jgi:superfamily II DNA/RNA helicase